MSYFTVDQANALAATTVRLATLVEFQFLSATERVHNGFGPITVGGNTYKGLGGLGSIEGLEEIRSAESHAVTLTLSGVDTTFLAKALAESSEVDGRLVLVTGQLFDASLVAIGSPVPLFIGYMQPPRIERSEPDEFGNATQTVSVVAENVFVGRHRPPAGRYTDREQQTRYPGDKFFAHTPGLVSKTLVFPDY